MSEKWAEWPWHFEADKEDDVVYVCHPETNSPDTTVCMFKVDGPEDIANAHLIAAAPEMYEALIAILPYVPISSASEGGAVSRSLNVLAADKVRAALKKARGES
jgi:hypothetical protein